MVYAQNAALDNKEKTVISGIFKFGKDGLIEAYDILRPDHFSNIDHQIIYRECVNLFENNVPITPGLVESRIKDCGIKTIEIPQANCDSLNLIRECANYVRNNHIIEGSKDLLVDSINKLDEANPSDKISDIFAVTESCLFDLVKKYAGTENSPPQLLGQGIKELLQDFIDNPGQNQGLPTPWNSYNESIGGGLRTGVHLFGARSGKGKTVLGLNCASHYAENGIPVLYLDTEMEHKNVAPRIIASMSEVEINEIESGAFAKNDFRKKEVGAAVKKIKNMPFYYKTVAGLPFDEILSIIRRWCWLNVGFNKDGKSKQCVIIYDYFKLMDTGDLKSLQEYQALGFQVSKLTDFCKHYDLPCLSFVQLNRDGVDKESETTISGSDRLLWLCNSFTIFKDKTAEEMSYEIENHGKSLGNKKIITLKSRYGGEHEYGKFSSLNMRKEISLIEELQEKYDEQVDMEL